MIEDIHKDRGERIKVLGECVRVLSDVLKHGSKGEARWPIGEDNDGYIFRQYVWWLRIW